MDKRFIDLLYNDSIELLFDSFTKRYKLISSKFDTYSKLYCSIVLSCLLDEPHYIELLRYLRLRDNILFNEIIVTFCEVKKQPYNLVLKQITLKIN